MHSCLSVSNYTRKHLETFRFPSLHSQRSHAKSAFRISGRAQIGARASNPASSIFFLVFFFRSRSNLRPASMRKKVPRTGTLSTQAINFLFMWCVVPNRMQFWTTNISYLNTRQKRALWSATTLSMQKIVDITACTVVFLDLRTSFEYGPFSWTK